VELEDIKVKVETKYCKYCSHHYQDHFTDSAKYPKPRKCVYGCGMPLCCYGGCKCGEYSPVITSVPYAIKAEDNGYLTFRNSYPYFTCKDCYHYVCYFDIVDREPTFNFETSYTGINPQKELDKIAKEVYKIRQRLKKPQPIPSPIPPIGDR